MRRLSVPKLIDRSLRQNPIKKWLDWPRSLTSVAWFLRSPDNSETESLEWYLSLAKAASLGDALTLGVPRDSRLRRRRTPRRGQFRVPVRAGAAHGVDPFVLADYYLVPFRSAIRDADARGIMCRRVTLAPLRCLHVALSPGALLAQLQRRAGRAHLPLKIDAQRA